MTLRFAALVKMLVPTLLSAVLLGLLFLFCRFAASMPTVGVALGWALLSGASAAGLAYRRTLHKVRRGFGLRAGGLLARLNAGRVVTMTVSFVVSATCVAGVVLSASRWGAVQWTLVALSVPVYPLVARAFGLRVGRELESPFKAAAVARASCWTVSVLLASASLAAFLLARDGAAYASFDEAYAAVGQPFSGAPCALLAEAGTLLGYCDALVAYGLDKVAGTSSVVAGLVRLVLGFSAYFGVASLVSVCHLGPGELRRVLLPLDAVGRAEVPTGEPPMARYVVAACILPVALVAGTLFTSRAVDEVRATEEYTAAQRFVRD